MTPRVLVVGSINMDLIVRLQRVPEQGETIHGEALRTAPGGKGANQAVACSRLGAETVMVGRVGEDEFGPKLRAGLASDSVDVAAVRVDRDAPSGVALILLDESADNRIIVTKGANARLGDEDVAAAAELLDGADAVLMPLEVPLPVVKAVAEEARARGVRSVLDAGPATPAAVAAGLPRLLDLISPNQTEAEAFTGVPVRDLDGARKAAARLREMGARDVVLKLGDQGSYWLGAAGEHHEPAFPVEPVDTTAAGDAFTGCLVVSLGEGMPMPEAIRRANAAGALACLELGAQPSMPSAAVVESFLQERTG
jgi:ribokinase